MPTDPRNPNGEGAQADYYPASKALQNKAGKTTRSLNSVLKEADQMLAGKQEEYLVIARADIEVQESAFQELSKDPDSEKAASDVYNIAMRMKSLGGTFGYPLLSQVQNNLCRFIDANDETNPLYLNVIEFHIDSVKQILAHKLTGDGGEIGSEMLKSLVKIATLHAEEDAT